MKKILKSELFLDVIGSFSIFMGVLIGFYILIFAVNFYDKSWTQWRLRNIEIDLKLEEKLLERDKVRAKRSEFLKSIEQNRNVSISEQNL